jgi:hypothetical protein
VVGCNLDHTSAARAADSAWGGRTRRGAGEILIFTAAFLIYFGVRALKEGSAATAVGDALHVRGLERALDVDWEAAVQRTVLQTHWLLDVANAI